MEKIEVPTINIYKLTSDREKQLWEKAIFIFDSSALLDFYFLPLITRSKVFDELFKIKLKDRLWIPAQVKYEYEKNREKVIRKPISENYKPLKDTNLKAIKTSIKEIESKVNDLKNRTKKDDKHPHLPQEEIDKYLSIIAVFKTDSEQFEELITKQITLAEEEINKLPTNDDVEKAVFNLFKVGRYYSFQEILEITKEGKHRFDYSIPPGYEDLNNNEKKGTQIFGDLIIWKQILEYAKEIKRPIIFVGNDLKEDWCYLEKTTNEKRIESPREELIKELYDYARVEFWMYNQAQFLYKSNEYFEAEIEQQNITNLFKFIGSKTKKKEELIFDCSKCEKKHFYKKEQLDLQFECVDSEERNMGTEKQYQAEEYFECECGNDINVTFEIWEYPIGVINYTDVEIEGGKLISCFDFSTSFNRIFEPDLEANSAICSKCGNVFNDYLNIGICNKCDREYSE